MIVIGKIGWILFGLVAILFGSLMLTVTHFCDNIWHTIQCWIIRIFGFGIIVGGIMLINAVVTT